MTKFYFLKERDFLTEKGYADTEVTSVGEREDRGEAPKCPVCSGKIGWLTWLPPYKIELTMHTKQFANVMIGGGCEELVVDDYFKDRYDATGMTGLEFLGDAEVTKIVCRGSPSPAKVAESVDVARR